MAGQNPQWDCGEYTKQKGLLPLMIQRGPMGLPGLCMTLEYFIGNNIVSETLLETQINNNLIDEVK